MSRVVHEKALVFPCGGEQLVGVLHVPESGASRRAVVMVVGGGPQYRSGGHRQLLLWARQLAAEGHAVLRFDYRGMGDSTGVFGGYATIDEDLRAAIDTLCRELPETREVVLWGECDATCAILTYAYRDARVKGMALQNVFVRTEAGQASAILRNYYWQRLMQPSFWRKVVRFEFNPFRSLAEVLGYARKAHAGKTTGKAAKPAAETGTRLQDALPTDLPLPERLLAGLKRFNGPVQMVLSGRDMVAQEFAILVKDSPAWQAALAEKPTTRHDMPLGDHTFSSAAQRDEVYAQTMAWLRTLPES
ncbi:hydrolase 1, exosortase A system-associated [Burkholderiaceae bacterium UC74_6]